MESVIGPNEDLTLPSENRTFTVKVYMKTLLAIVAITIGLSTSAFSQAIGIGQFAVINTSTTVPKQLTNSVVLAKRITFIGKSTHQGSGNAGTVWIGTSSVDGANCYDITSGTVHYFDPPFSGGYIDLSTIYVDVATANDGLVVIYE